MFNNLNVSSRSTLGHYCDEVFPTGAIAQTRAAQLLGDDAGHQGDPKFGLAIPGWRIIVVTAEASAISQFEICCRTRIDKVAVSREAIALVERGLVKRLPNPNDQRSLLLALSEQGRRVYRRVVPKALEIEKQIFGDFGAAETLHAGANRCSCPAASGRAAAAGEYQ